MNMINAEQFKEFCMKEKIAIRFFSREQHIHILALLDYNVNTTDYGLCALYWHLWGDTVIESYSSEHYFYPDDLEKFQLPSEWSVEKHKGVVRKGDGSPYIIHPMRVLISLQSIKKSKNAFLLAAAAILHDVVEDCEVSIEEISQKFGLHVACLVQELTSDSEEIKKQGKTEYLTQKMLKMSSYALCIKLVDRLDNIRDMKSLSKEVVKKQIDSTVSILNTLKTGRKLTKTHAKLVKLIEKEIKNYEKV